MAGIPDAQPIYQVDAFSDRPFAGNPAAVCPLDGASNWPDTAWMQAVSAEMNLSETAFLLPQGERWGLRWFTPTVEVDLCGHATLASAHLLWASGRAPKGRIDFDSRSGPLAATQGVEQGDEDEVEDWIWLDFPADPPRPVVPPEDLQAALGVAPQQVLRGVSDLLVALPSEQAVRELTPDLARIARWPYRGLIVTATGAGAFDFVSRFFGPGAGIDEDPVTGSAHCTLAPYWYERTGRANLTGFQASARGGVVRVKNGPRVALGGQAVTVMTGCLTLGG